MKELVYHRLFLPGLDAFADKPDTIIDGEYRSTLGQHADRVFRLGHALKHQLGVQPGDRVAVMSTNSHQYLELYHACFLGAAVINPLNLRLAGKELDYILRDSGTEVIFVDGFFGGAIAAAMAASDAGPSPLRHVVLMGDPVDPNNVPAHDVAYEDLIAAGEPVVPDEPEEDDPVVLMYTGGTTGLPKGVLLEQRAEMLNSYHTMGVVSIDAEQIFLHQTPMFHAASMGAILGIPALGAGSVFIPLFDPGKAMDLIEGNGVTWTVMVPTMIGMLLNHPEFAPERLATLKQLTYGASPMPVGHPRQAARALPRPADQPGLRHDRGLGRADLPHRRRPLRRRRAPALGRPPGARRAPLDPGRRGQRRRQGRDRRGLRQGRQLHAGVLEQARGHRGGLPGWLVPHR